MLDLIDLVLVMSVNPGFGGQAFIPSALGKIRDIRAMTAGRPIDIEVDGGVGADVSGQLAAAGANALVAGSAVFKGGTMEVLQGEHRRDPQCRAAGARRGDLRARVARAFVADDIDFKEPGRHATPSLRGEAKQSIAPQAEMWIASLRSQ